MKNNNGTPVQHQQVNWKRKKEKKSLYQKKKKKLNLAIWGGFQVCEKAEGDRGKEDLRSRGLCLVPISSTFPVTNATTPDFWTPTFGGTFR